MGRGSSKAGGGGGNAADRALANGLPENERKDIYFFRGAMPTSKEDLKYSNVLVNADFPALSGTEKQVKYAQDLIRKRTQSFIDSMLDHLPKEQYRDSRKKAIDQLVSKTNQAGGKAKNLSDVINFMIEKSPNSALVFAKKHPNAKEIIEKYK